MVPIRSVPSEGLAAASGGGLARMAVVPLGRGSGTDIGLAAADPGHDCGLNSRKAKGRAEALPFVIDDYLFGLLCYAALLSHESLLWCHAKVAPTWEIRFEADGETECHHV